MPGTMHRNGISSLKNPAVIVPIRASQSLRAPSVRCTMNWLVPQ